MHGRGLVRKSALERPYQCISPWTILRPANLPFSGLCETGMAGAGRLHAGVDGGAKPRATARPAGRRWCPTPPRAGLLAYVLAIMSGANATTLREHTLRAAERAEAELGDERSSFIDGQSIPEDRDARHVGLVYTYDPKPKRRLFDLLKSQGLQANQDVTFLTDGGEEVRSLAERVTPESEHVLDWFHITMRLTVLCHTHAVLLTMMRPRVRVCWPNWNGSSGCSGTAISIEPEKQSASS